jgi:CDP-diacylglycerol--serine O-phosphatidyltransferase
VLRLARFNTRVGEPDLPPWAHNYFTGVPSPGGAGISILPLIFWLFTGWDFFKSPMIAGAFLLASSMLMISRVPVYAGKHLRLKPQMMLLVMVAIIALVGFLVTDPWPTLSLVGILYIGAIPVSYWTFKRLKARGVQEPAPIPSTSN